MSAVEGVCSTVPGANRTERGTRNLNFATDSDIRSRTFSIGHAW